MKSCADLNLASFDLLRDLKRNYCPEVGLSELSPALIDKDLALTLGHESFFEINLTRMKLIV